MRNLAWALACTNPGIPHLTLSPLALGILQPSQGAPLLAVPHHASLPVLHRLAATWQAGNVNRRRE